MFHIRLFERKVGRMLGGFLSQQKNVSSDALEQSNQVDLRLLSQLKRLARSAGTGSFYKDGFTCVQIECKVCCTKSKPIAYVNKVTGMFTCPTCEFSENLAKVFPLYDSQSRKSLTETVYSSLKLTAQQTKRQHQFQNGNVDKLIQATSYNLEQLGLSVSQSVLTDLEVKYNESNGYLHFPLKNVTGMIVGEKILHSNEESTESTFPHDDCSGILKYSPLQKDTNKAILVLNILDFLALCTQKIDATIICLPYWLKTLPQNCLPNLENFNKLILWFDFDVAGWDTARHFARKLDERRCLFIRPTDEQPTPFKAVNKQLNLKSIVSKAQSVLHKSITTFSMLKQDVLSELQNVEKVNGVKWKRYPVLNKLLKGHRKGELTILTGPTGCGKTTFMSEYSLDLALQGVTTLWGSFEIRNTRLAATLLRQLVGYPLDEKIEEFDFWAKEMEKLPIYYMTFHGQQSIKIVMEAIEHAQYVHDIQHVIIDNVQFMLGISSSSRQDKFWEQDSVIAAFRTFATKRNVHVTLVMHPRKERDADDLTTSSIFGSAKASQEADNVLIIQDKRLTSVRGRKFLQVAKNRYSGDLGIMPLEFNKEALSYATKKTTKTSTE